MSVRPLEGFLAVRSEGGLLPADLLQRIVTGDRELEGLDPERDYHLAGGERLNEAVSRSWQRLLGAWRNFRAAASFLEPGDAATTLTRERWLLVLFQELGYGRLSTSKAASIEGRDYPLSHMWQRVPIHLVGCQVEIDRRTPGVAGAARTTPHGLVQDFLNRSPDHVWGFVSNGLRLRILRDNARLTRQAYVEFDVETIFENELYADFGLLWLVCHQSRVEQDRPEAYWLERWRESAAKEGARALDTLRDGVEAALAALGRGFLAHPANTQLTTDLRTGSLSTQDYYRELLRLVYRLLFLFVAEDRNLLHPSDAAVTARQRYSSHYSSRRLRELARRMRGSEHADLFQTFKVVVGGLSGDQGCSALGLSALGGLLWSAQAAPHLDTAWLANRSWLEAVRALAYTRQDGVLRPVDWRNLGSTEFGSVYESLLELHPDVNADAATFSLSSGAGNERKTSGSYYTPESLVQCLLDAALEPVLTEATAKPDPQDAILAIKVCDPACGSGHFLIAAAHRIARRLAKVRTGDEEPAPEATRTALRDVVGRCVYGVDLNPMAAELCKVNLWLEGLEPGRPLSFLDHHVRVGDSLLGATPELVAGDLPDEAFESIEGDDRKTCAALKKRNRKERHGQRDMLYLMVGEPGAEYLGLADQAAALDNIEDTSVAGVLEKESRFQQLVHSDKYRHAQLVADAWCAAFVWKKISDGKTPGCITTDSFRRLKADVAALSKAEEDEVRRISGNFCFFHWHVMFPEITARGGFDVVLGNPPWEKLQAEEQEFFAFRDESIAEASARTRKRLIDELEQSNPPLFAEWLQHKRHAAALDSLLKNTGRFPLTGSGKLNTYSLFAELALQLTAPRGRVGCVLPLGIVTDEGSSRFFGELVTKRHLSAVLGFENESMLFPSVHHSFKFCLLVLAGRGAAMSATDLVFFCRSVEEVRDPTRTYRLGPDDVVQLNPNTLTCPIFRGAREAEVVRYVYRRLPVIGAEQGQPSWKVRIQRILNSTDDVDLFDTVEARPGRRHLIEKDDGIAWEPVYEAKMVHQFDHRFGTYVGQTEAQANQGKLPELRADDHADADCFAQPRWWVQTKTGAERTRALFPHAWVVVFRDITSPVVLRTAIAAILPHFCTTETCRCVFFEEEPHAQLAVAFVAAFNSFVFDFVCRTKFSGNHLSTFVVKQLPMPPAVGLEGLLDKHHLPREWVRSRVLELTYTAWDLMPFAQDCGWNGPPFRWDEGRRFLLRCELDALFFHIYLGSEDEWLEQPEALRKAFRTPREAVDYIMESFPVVKRKDEEAHGEYRTKRVILEIYDEMQQAMVTGREYQTRLDPPPADPSVAHSAEEVVTAAVGPAKVLPFRRLGRAPKREERYATVVPLLTLKVAAGAFGETQDVEFNEWVEPANPPRLQKGMFLAQVTGRSMEPEIPEGSYCLFRYVRPGSREGKIVLVQLHGHSDPESGGSYTVKRYHSEKERDEDGGWRHARIVLEPANPNFEPIVLGAENEGEVKVVAELVKVL